MADGLRETCVVCELVVQGLNQEWECEDGLDKRQGAMTPNDIPMKEALN